MKIMGITGTQRSTQSSQTGFFTNYPGHREPIEKVSCLHCAYGFSKTLWIHCRGLCRKCYRNPEIRIHYPSKRVHGKLRVQAPIYNPTAEEITLACEQIQRSWTSRHERLARVTKNHVVILTECSTFSRWGIHES